MAGLCSTCGGEVGKPWPRCPTACVCDVAKVVHLQRPHVEAIAQRGSLTGEEYVKRRGLPIAPGDPVRLDTRDQYGKPVHTWARVVEVRAKDLVVDLTGARVAVEGSLWRHVVDGDLTLKSLGYVLTVTRQEPWRKPSRGASVKAPAIERAAARKVRS